MADTLGALVVSLTAETASFQDAMTRAAYQTNQAMGQIVSSIDGVAGRFALLEQAASALIFSQAIRGAADFVTSMVDAQAHLQDLAVSIGTSASQMSALVPAAVLSGTSLDSAANATARLERSLSPLSVTAKIAKEALASLGFSAEDAARFLKDPSEGLLEIAQRLNTFADDGNKTAIVMALMGRGAREMLPFLKQLGDQTALTATVTDQQAAAAKALVVQWNEVKLRGEELRNSISTALVPAFSEILTAITNVSGGSDGLGAKLRSLATDGSITKWAIEGAIAIGTLGESLVAMGRIVMGIASDLELMIADLQLVNAAAGAPRLKPTGSLGFSPEEAQQANAALDAALKNRNNILAENNKLWTEGLAANGAALTDALKKELADLQRYQGTFAASMAAMAALPQNADSTDRRLYGHAAQAPAEKGHLDATAGAAKAAKTAINELAAALDAMELSLGKTGAGLDAQLKSLQQYGIAVKSTEVATTEYELTNGKLGDKLAALDVLYPQMADALRHAVLAQAQHNDATKAEIELTTQNIAAHTKWLDAINSSNEQLDKQAKSLTDQAATIGMTKDQLQAYRAAQDDANISLAQYTADVMAAISPDQALVMLLQQHVIELQKVRDATVKLGIADAAKEAQQAWKQAANSIENDLITAFDDWVKGGKNLAQQLKDELLKMFDTLVLQPIIAPIAGSIAGLAAGPAGASQVQGVINTGSSALNLFGGGGLTSSIGDAIFGQGGASAFAAGVASPFSTLGAIFSGSGDFAVPGLAAASGLGALVPVLGIATLVASIFGSKGGGPKDGGSASNIPGADRFYTPNQSDSSLQQLVAGDTSAYNTTLAALGGKGTAGFGFGYDVDSQGTANSRLSTAATVNGQSVYGFTNRDEGRGDAGVKADLSLEAQRALLAALQASDLPKDIANILDSITPSSASAAQVQQVLALGTAYAQLGDMLKANPLQDALSAIKTQAQGAYGAFQTTSTAFTSLLSTYDGSTTATVALDKASQAYYASLVALLAQIQQVKQSIDTMFGDTIRNFQIQSLDKQGQYAYYQQDAQSTLSGIRTATDPAQIQRLETQYNADLTSAFGLLDQSQRTALLSQFIDAANTGDAAGNTRLTQIGATAAGTFNASITAAQAAITKAATDMATAAGTIKDSSTTISTASGNILRASNTPVHVVLTVNTTTGEVNQGG